MTANPNGERLLSLDCLRGLIMVTLMIGETGFFTKWYRAAPNSFTRLLATQFEHSVWHGLRFWDVILPAFMLIAGTAMAFSYHKQQQLLYTWRQSFLKVLKKLLAAFLGCPNLCRARPTSEFSTQQCADAARLHHGYCLPGYPHASVVAIGSEFVVPAHPRIVSPVYAPT